MSEDDSRLPRVSALLLSNWIVLIFVAAVQAVVPFIPLQARDLGFGAATLGVLVGAQGLGALLMSLPGAVWIDAVGPAKFAFVGSLATGLTLAALAFWPSTLSLVLAVLTLGAAQTVVGMAGQMLVVAATARNKQDRAISFHFFFVSLGLVAGPLLSASILRAGGSIQQVFLAAGLACTVCGIVALSAFGVVRLNVAPRGDSSTGMLPLSPGIRVALVATFVTEFSYIVWATFFPLAMQGAGYSPAFIGFAFSLRGLAIASVRPALPLLLSRYTRLRALAASLIALSGGLMLSAVPFSSALSLAAALLFGVAVGLAIPIPLTLLVSENAVWSLGRLLGLRTFVNKAGYMLGPVLLGPVAGRTLGGALGIVAVMCAATGIWVLSRAPSSEEKVELSSERS